MGPAAILASNIARLYSKCDTSKRAKSDFEKGPSFPSRGYGRKAASYSSICQMDEYDASRLRNIKKCRFLTVCGRVMARRLFALFAIPCAAILAYVRASRRLRVSLSLGDERPVRGRGADGGCHHCPPRQSRNFEKSITGTRSQLRELKTLSTVPFMLTLLISNLNSMPSPTLIYELHLPYCSGVGLKGLEWLFLALTERSLKE